MAMNVGQLIDVLKGYDPLGIVLVQVNGGLLGDEVGSVLNVERSPNLDDDGNDIDIPVLIVPDIEAVIDPPGMG